MFESQYELVSELMRVGLGDYAKQIGALAKPCLYFSETSGQPPRGLVATKLGGSPELPIGATWPYRNPLPHAEAFKEWIRHDGIARVWGAPLPLTFFAQIDLGEAARAFAGEWPLPSHGRLHLFWDSLCGCYGQGVANTRVIWDDTAPSRLTPLEFPVSDYPQDVAAFPCVAPERRLSPRPAWSCPDRPMVDWLIPDKVLHGLLRDEPFEQLYWKERIHAWSFKDESRIHRMLGWSTPIQDEPAVAALGEAAGIEDVPVKWSTAEQIKPLLPAMKDWLLLLQIDMANAFRENEYVEGMVYFMILEEDARAGRFDRVSAVHQQT